MLKSLLRFLHAPVYEKRITVLANEILKFVDEGDNILDVGCGMGMLGKAIITSPKCPQNVRLSGLESHRRGGEVIDVIEYDGKNFPYEGKSFDIVILADVLHHESNPEYLFAECLRVAKRLIFVKDHKVDGLFAHTRISFLDWAANTGYSVKCLFVYKTQKEWKDFWENFPVKLEQEINLMNIYPAGLNLLFGRRLHYCAVLKVSEQDDVERQIP
jgi:SAM-dependent methyltransferase